MKASALAGEELARDGLAEQGVTEAEGPLATHLEDLVVDRLLEGVVEGIGVEPGDDTEEVGVDRAPRQRGGADEETCRGVEAVQPEAEEAGEVLRGRGAVPGRDDLLGEEWVAPGPVDDLADVAGRRRPVLEVAHETVHLLRRERRQLDARHQRQPGPDAEHLVQRVATVEVVAAVGDDEGDGSVEASGEEDGQEVA